MDLVNPISSESVEKRKEDMSSLAAGFVARICKRAASTQRKTTSNSEGPDDK